MFLGINMFLALLRPHFNPRYARAKMSLTRAKNIFMPKNINSILLIYYNKVKFQLHYIYKSFVFYFFSKARAVKEYSYIKSDTNVFLYTYN